MSTMMRLSAKALAVLCSSAVPFVLSQSTLATVLLNRNDLVSFKKILDASGYSADLFRSASFDGTVFAPNDDAFAQFPASISTMLLESEWSEHTVCFVSHHTVEGTFLSNSLMDGMNLTTLSGDNLTVSLNPTGVNQANIVEADVFASNGVIHIIDTVLTPACVNESVLEKLTANGTFSILLELVELAGLSEMLTTSSPITLFAPPNAAWEEPGDRFIENLSDPDNVNFLRAFLMNHVLNGNWYSSRIDTSEPFTLETALETTAFFYNQSDVMFVNNAAIENGDLLASNGVMHTTDSPVILAALDDILTNSPILSNVISFTNFTAALKQANFFDALSLDSLNTPRTTTVFAPGDNAFANVPTEMLNKLLDPDWSFHLRELLRYHLVDGTLKSNALSELDMLATLADFNLTVTSEGSSLKVDDANIIVPDLSAYNGVIHGIDEVLFPPSLTATVMDQLRASSEFTTFLGILEAASENITSFVEGSGPMTLFIPTNSAFELFDKEVNFSHFDVDMTEMILQYHLVESNVYLNDLPNGEQITTLNGQDVVVSMVNATEDVRLINTAEVLDGGLASNGVIYVLALVLVPNELPTPNPTVSPAPTSPSASSPNVMPTSGPDSTSASTALRLCSGVFYAVAILSSFFY